MCNFLILKQLALWYFFMQFFKGERKRRGKREEERETERERKRTRTFVL